MFEQKDTRKSIKDANFPIHPTNSFEVIIGNRMSDRLSFNSALRISGDAEIADMVRWPK